MKRLKLLALSGAALGALTFSATAADLGAPFGEPANPWDAFVSVGAGYSWFGVDDDFAGPSDDFDGFNAEVRASAAYQFEGGFGLQSDLVFNYQDLDVDDDPNIKNVDAAFHAFYRNDSWLVGVFGQYGLSSIDLGAFSEDVDRYYAGGEAQYYAGNATFYLQGGWQGLDSDLLAAGDDISGFFINGEVRYFVNDNLKLALNGGYESLTFEIAGGPVSEIDFDTFKVGGTVEYRFEASPFSAFLNAEHRISEMEFDSTEFHETRVLAGVKLNLGTQTLIERDRAGASLAPVRPTALGAPTFF